MSNNRIDLHRFSSVRRQTGQGGQLVSSGLAWIAAIVILGGLVMFGYSRIQGLQANDVASRLQALLTAGNQYLNAYGAEIADSGLLSVGSAPVVIPLGKLDASAPVPHGPPLPAGGYLPSVQGAGFLSSDYVDRDAFGQSHDLVITEPKSGQYNALIVSTGGAETTNEMLGRILERFPGQGGAIAVPSAGISAARSKEIAGADRSWSIPLSAIDTGGVTIASPGHYAVLLSNEMTPSELTMSQYLSRNSLPGNRNAMSANIRMNSNALENAGSVTFGASGGGGSVTSTGPGQISVQASTIQSAGNQAVTGNGAIGGNLSIGNVDSLGTLDVKSSAAVSGNAVAGALAAGSATIGASGGASQLTVGSSSSPSTMSAGSMTVSGPLSVSDTAAISGAANVTGSASVGGNMVVTGPLTQGSHVVPLYQASLNQPCSSPGEYARGTYTDAAGRPQTAELFCEGTNSGNFWQGAIGAAGYAAPIAAKVQTLDANIEILGGSGCKNTAGVGAVCLFRLSAAATQPCTAGQQYYLRVTSMNGQGPPWKPTYPCSSNPIGVCGFAPAWLALARTITGYQGPPFVCQGGSIQAAAEAEEPGNDQYPLPLSFSDQAGSAEFKPTGGLGGGWSVIQN